MLIEGIFVLSAVVEKVENHVEIRGERRDRLLVKLKDSRHAEAVVESWVLVEDFYGLDELD